MIGGYIVLLAALFCGSAFFSGSESAFFSIDRITLGKLADAPSRTARAIPRLLADPGRLLATLLLGNELINITISAVGAQLVFVLSGEAGGDLWWVNIVLMTPMLLLFGEIGPKVIAVRNSVAWAAAVSMPLRAFALIFWRLHIGNKNITLNARHGFNIFSGLFKTLILL